MLEYKVNIPIDLLIMEHVTILLLHKSLCLFIQQSGMTMIALPDQTLMQVSFLVEESNKK